MTDVTNEVRSKVDPIIMGQILCFDKKWQIPKDFLNLTLKQRRGLQMVFSENSEPFKTDNLWVWFGSYSSDKPAVARYNSLSVRKILYKSLINSEFPDEQRLGMKIKVNDFDINPYRCVPQKGIKHSALLDFVREQSGDNDVLTMITEKERAKINKLIDKCVQDMDEYYNEEYFNKKEHFIKMLRNEYPLLIIEEAFKHTTLPIRIA